ncbi:hypothetical protein [Spirosoma sp.]|uniref:hypothetical protein n=1 Tax=Spirosoma sp. TaxID=1899569 RepID=UPI003B3BA56D
MSFIHTLIIWLPAYLTMTISNGQSIPKSITGEYYLTDVREVGSGIKLNPDATFEFFFAYGALDRFGSGTWKQHGSQIILTSRPRPEKDFALVTSQTVPGNKLTIRIIDSNKHLLRYVSIVAQNDTDVLHETTDAEGKVSFARQALKSISLRFELCPDRYSVFEVTNQTHNYYEFRFEPWISEVFFENVVYTLSEGELSGPHPLLEPGKTYSFERN